VHSLRQLSCDKKETCSLIFASRCGLNTRGEKARRSTRAPSYSEELVLKTHSEQNFESWEYVCTHTNRLSLHTHAVSSCVCRGIVTCGLYPRALYDYMCMYVQCIRISFRGPVAAQGSAKPIHRGVGGERAPEVHRSLMPQRDPMQVDHAQRCVEGKRCEKLDQIGPLWKRPQETRMALSSMPLLSKCIHNKHCFEAHSSRSLPHASVSRFVVFTFLRSHSTRLEKGQRLFGFFFEVFEYSVCQHKISLLEIRVKPPPLVQPPLMLDFCRGFCLIKGITISPCPSRAGAAAVTSSPTDAFLPFPSPPPLTTNCASMFNTP